MNTELRTLLTSGIKIRQKLLVSGKSKANLGGLTASVAYWIATSKNVEKTAVLRRNEILIVLPPNFVGKFEKLMEGIEK